MRNVLSARTDGKRRKKGRPGDAAALTESVDKLTSNRILLRGGGRRGENAGTTGEYPGHGDEER